MSIVSNVSNTIAFDRGENERARYYTCYTLVETKRSPVFHDVCNCDR